MSSCYLLLKNLEIFLEKEKRGKQQKCCNPLKSSKRETGFEPATFALARRYSTTEPLAHIMMCHYLAGLSVAVFREHVS